MSTANSSTEQQIHREINDAGFGLSLSGGGFRATLFHLGVIAFLLDRDLVKHVKLVTSVSGGSILAAHMACNWDRYNGTHEEFEEVANELIAFTRNDLRGYIIRRWILGTVLVFPRLLGRMNIASSMMRKLDKLYKSSTVRQLTPKKGKPEFQILSTSLTTGKLCKFTCKGFVVVEDHSDPDDREKLTESWSLKVATAVAASAAFPPLFPPVPIDYEALHVDVKDFDRTQHLTDGGIFDNLGLQELHHLATNRKGFMVPTILVSNAGGSFDWKIEEDFHFIVTRNVRATDIVMNRVGNLIPQLLSGSDLRICTINIGDSGDPAINPLSLTPDAQNKTKNIRTDLDAFSVDEIHALVKHGYTCAAHSLCNVSMVCSQPNTSDWKLVKNDIRPKFIARQERRRARIFSVYDMKSWMAGAVLLGWVYLGIAIYPYLHHHVSSWFRPSIATLEQNKITITIFTHTSEKDMKDPSQKPASEPNPLGARQVRGVIAGIYHTMNELKEQNISPLGEWDQYFAIRVINTSEMSSAKEGQQNLLFEAFETEQKRSEVIFGPATSAEATTVLVKSKYEPQTLTILTSAGSGDIRLADLYGSKIWQLSDNDKVIADQYARFVVHALTPHPKKVLIAYNDRLPAFAQSGAEFLRGSLWDYIRNDTQYHGDDVEGPIAYSPPESEDQKVISDSICKQLERHFGEVKNSRKDAMIIFQDYGDSLRAAVSCARSEFPSEQKNDSTVSIGTMATVDPDSLRNHMFDSVYVIYSYPPEKSSEINYTYTNASFADSVRRAEDYISKNYKSLGFPSAPKWEGIEVDSDDAESHDAAIYFLKQEVLPKYSESLVDPLHNLYVTDFVINGSSKDFGNHGNLLLFQVKNSQLERIKITKPENK